MDSSSSSIIIMDDSISDSTVIPSSSSGILKKEEYPPSVTVKVEEGSILTPLIHRRKTRSMKDEGNSCIHCGMMFSKPGNRNKHIRKIHGIEPDLKVVEQREKECIECGIIFPSTSQYHKHRKDEHGTVHCCIPECSWRASSHKSLVKHAAETHSNNGKKFEWERRLMENVEEFNQFIREMYEMGHLWYIRNGSNSTTVEKIEYRYCYKEDRRRGRETMKRPMKKGKKRTKKKRVKEEDEEEKEIVVPRRILGLERTDECCTSYMRVKWKGDGTLEVEYCVDHLAHENETTCLPLLDEHKMEIREILEEEGGDPEEVVKRLKEKYGESGGRLANIEEEDVREIVMEEFDPFGEMRETREIREMKMEVEDGSVGGTAVITMEFSPSPSHEEGTDTSSALLALLDEHRDTTTLGDLVASAQTQPSGSGTKKKMPRFKLTDNGFVFRFDKNSVCGERQFWRCERKSECAARIHTDMKGTIVKRINYHTHPSNPNPEHIHIPKKKARMSPNDLSMDLAENTGLLPIPPRFLSGGNDDNFPSMVNGGLNGLLDAFVKEEEGLSDAMLNNGEETGVGPSENSSMDNGMERMGMSDDFWRVFHLTKKVYEVVKNEVEMNNHSKEEDQFVYGEVKRFIDDHRLTEFGSKLHRYSKTELLRLNKDECKDVLDNRAEGVRMYHAIRSEWGKWMDELSDENGKEKSDLSHASIKVYVSSAEEITPIYKMVSLPEGMRSIQSFKEGLTRRGIMNEKETICVNEGRLTVELCDEMMQEWKDDRVFRYQRNGDYLILEPLEGI